MDSGWRLLKGAGGYVYVHYDNRWATKWYPTVELANVAAEQLETRAMATLEAQERGRLALRELYGRRERAKAREEEQP